MKKINSILDISNINRISFREDINGLRAIAVLAVVFYHADIQLFKGGWLGVDIFFVISGYLISNIIISELNEGTFTFKNFYLRRIRRILPALFSTLVLSIPFAYFLLTPKAMEEFVDSVTASIFFYANYYFVGLDFYVSESTKVMPLLHTWSLAIEEQYYLLFPIFTFIVFKYCKKYLAHLIISLSVVSIYLNTIAEGEDKFYLLQYRLWELLFGVIVMILSSNLSIKHLEKIGLPMMIFPIFYFEDTWINDTEPKLIALLGISLIIFSNTENTSTTKLLSLKPFSIIGLSSYSIYLLHQPLFAFYRVFKSNVEYRYLRTFTKPSYDVVNDSPTPDSSIGLILLIGLILILVLLGNLSYKYVETKNMNLRWPIYCVIILLTFVSGMKLRPSVFNSFNESQSSITNETIFSDYSCWYKFQDWYESFEFLNSCYVDNKSEETLVILGDSSTAAYAKSLLKTNTLGNKYNFLFLSTIYTTFFQELDIDSDCENCILAWLKENKNTSTILISLQLHRYIEEMPNIYYSELSINNSESTLYKNIKNLASVSKNVILLESFPTSIVNKLGPKEILLFKNSDNINEIYLQLSDWKNNTIKADEFYQKINSEINNLEFIRTSDIFCKTDTNKCTIYRYPDLYYLDSVHLTTEGADLVIKKVSRYLK